MTAPLRPFHIALVAAFTLAACSSPKASSSSSGGAGGTAGAAGGISAGGTAGAGGSTIADPTDPAVRARLTSIHDRVATLATEVIGFWRAKGPDPVNGGFYGDLDRLGAPSTPTDKGLVQQSRHLWAFSNWYERVEPTPEVKAIADGAYRFLIDHMYDATTQEFQFKVSETGAAVDSRKLLYGEGFAIYGLSTYGRVFSIPEAVDYAMGVFQAIDVQHDATNLGYDEHNDAGWLGAGSQKSTNVHIHLMEAFTALYAATSDSVVRDRLNELVDVTMTKILQNTPPVYDAQEFLNDWTPNGAPLVSYGHDLETAWLLHDAATALGRADEPGVKDAMLAMGEAAAASGYDSASGGYFENGVPGGAPSSTDKIWWVESEALSGLLWMYRLTNDTLYLDRLESTLTFIEQHQRDNENPGTEWFWGLTIDNAINSRGDHKGEEWKASYHNSRALTFTGAWIDEMLQ